jgi:hypothetical protein
MKTIIQWLLVSLAFTLLIEAKATEKEISTIMNLAGKQRMLTQKMSKEALLLAKEINVEENKEELKRTISLFDTTLKALLDGNATLKLPKTEDKEIRKRIQEVEKLWREFEPFIDNVAECKFNRTSLKAIEMGNIPLLSIMNDVVKMYEEKYTSSLNDNMLSTINLAGKERMLSQKMIKELLLIAHNLESNSYMKSLREGGSFFNDTLSELMKDKESISNPHISKEIKAIQKLWDEYQHAIAHTELSKEGLLVFSKKEKKIIEKMTFKLITVATKIDKKRYQNELLKSVKEFETILNGLINGDSKLGIIKSENKKIQKELMTVKKDWKEYREITINIDVSDNALKKAMKLNILILNTMDSVVKLYEINR